MLPQPVPSQIKASLACKSVTYHRSRMDAGVGAFERSVRRGPDDIAIEPPEPRQTLSGRIAALESGCRGGRRKAGGGRSPAATPGRIRTLSEFRRLLADSGLEVTARIPIRASVELIEARAALAEPTATTD